jgi:hypothetical protein
MIDIHPPQHAAITRRDFFVHLGIVVLGILIAIGLEQTVEYFHHRDQVADLGEQMRVEAQNNLPLIRDSITRLETQNAYIRSLESALLTGKVSADNIDVRGVTPPGGSAMYISPSRATWSSAEAAGLTALLPPGQAKLYARLDFNTEGEIGADGALHEGLRTLISECVRAHYDRSNPGISRITIAHRDDLLFQLQQVIGEMEGLTGWLGLVEGGDEAIVAGARSLDEMYPYQKAALNKIHSRGSLGNFYGGSRTLSVQQTSDHHDTPDR